MLLSMIMDTLILRIRTLLKLCFCLFWHFFYFSIFLVIRVVIHNADFISMLYLLLDVGRIVFFRRLCFFPLLYFYFTYKYFLPRKVVLLLCGGSHR